MHEQIKLKKYFFLLKRRLRVSARKKLFILLVCTISCISLFFKTNYETILTNQNNNVIFKSHCECQTYEEIALTKFDTHYQVASLNKLTNKETILYNIEFDEFHKLNLTCNLYDTLRRGKGRKVLSYSLYGKQDKYYRKLKSIMKQVKQIFPNDWTIRIYHDDSINKSIICELKCLKESNGQMMDVVDFCNIQNEVNLKPISFESLNNKSQLKFDYVHAMKWRFFPIGDSFVDAFLSRDTDSNVLQRQFDSVKVWLESDKVGHIMRG